MKEGDWTYFTGRACRCQVECLLDGPAGASHADRGVAHGVRRPVKVLLGSELPPPSSSPSSVSVGMMRIREDGRLSAVDENNWMSFIDVGCKAHRVGIADPKGSIPWGM